MVEQLIRNERVNGSNPLSGSPLPEGLYLLKLTYLDILADVTEGNVWTPTGLHDSTVSLALRNGPKVNAASKRKILQEANAWVMCQTRCFPR